MLNISTLTVTSPLRPPSILRRGGQPVNSNALRHGFYAVRNPTPLTTLRTTIATCRQIPLSIPGMYEQVIAELRLNLEQAFVSLLNANTASGKVTAMNRLVTLASGMVKVSGVWYAQTQPMRDLQGVARRIPAAIRYHFHRHDITRDANSFRNILEKSDFNSPLFKESPTGTPSDPSSLFLSPHQWRILEPLLPPPERRSSRGRPNADPRALLDAVFWKIAHHARWQDLPAFYPPMLTCRRYYRRLYRSGRLATLYIALFNHLVTSGYGDLLDFVDRGCFSIRQNKVVLAPGIGNSWQLHTALLFLQVGIQELRQCRLINILEHRKKFPTLKAFMKRRQAMQAPPPVSDEPVYIPFDLGSSGFVSSKNQDLASSNFHSNHSWASSGLSASAKQTPQYPPGHPKEAYIPFFEREERGLHDAAGIGPFSPPGRECQRSKNPCLLP